MHVTNKRALAQYAMRAMKVYDTQSLSRVSIYRIFRDNSHNLNQHNTVRNSSTRIGRICRMREMIRVRVRERTNGICRIGKIGGDTA